MILGTGASSSWVSSAITLISATSVLSTSSTLIKSTSTTSAISSLASASHSTSATVSTATSGWTAAQDSEPTTVAGYTTFRVGSPLMYTRTPSVTQAASTSSVETDPVVGSEDGGILTESTKLKRADGESAVMCLPELQLVLGSPLSEQTFNDKNSLLNMVATCGESFHVTDCSAYINGQPAPSVSCNGNSVQIPRIFGNANDTAHVSVMVVDGHDNEVTKAFTFAVGSSKLDITVKKSDGSPAAGAKVDLTHATYPDAHQVVLADGNGVASFHNVPEHTLGFTATLGTAVGVGSIAGGLYDRTELLLKDNLADPSKLPQVMGPSGSAGWTGDVHDTPDHDNGSMVWTNGQSHTQLARRSFRVPSEEEFGGNRTVYIVYRFQSAEATGGNWGSQYNVFFHVGIHGSDGNSATSQVHGIDDLGSGYFDKSGYTPWTSMQLTLPPAAEAVEFTAAVSNVNDASKQSQIIIKDTGLCDANASCDVCPGFARCQTFCQDPLPDTCVFYRTCARQGLQCDMSAVSIMVNAAICDGFQRSAKHQMSAAGAQYFANVQQCVQRALATALTQQTTCADAGLLASTVLGDCYAQENICDMEKRDYVEIVGLLTSHEHRAMFQSAVTKASGTCAAKIANVLTDGDDYARPAKGFFTRLETGKCLSSTEKAAEYVESVDVVVSNYTAVTIGSLAQYLRWFTCDTFLGLKLTGSGVPTGLRQYMEDQTYNLPPNTYIDSNTTVTLSEVFCAASAILGMGPTSDEADLASWGSLLFASFWDFRMATFKSSFATSAHEFLLQWNSEHADAVYAAVDGYVAGMLSKTGQASASSADGFRETFALGPFDKRVEVFQGVRFGGDLEKMEERCGELLSGGLADGNRIVWAVRTAAGLKGGIDSQWARSTEKNWEAAVVDSFCGDFVDTFGKF